MENEKKVLDEEVLSAKIQEVLAQINSCTNPDEIEAIKKLIKKNVPFTRRGYFAAMVLKMMMDKPQRERRPERAEKFQKPREERKPREEKKAAPAPQAEGAAPAEEKQEKQERVLPEDAKTLYLNVGKMKHLYAKDLSKLLQRELGITRDDIYVLRVHDKYSFITMSEENCNKAIEKLNGTDINGRTAQINFSNK